MGIEYNLNTILFANPAFIANRLVKNILFLFQLNRNRVKEDFTAMSC